MSAKGRLVVALMVVGLAALSIALQVLGSVISEVLGTVMVFALFGLGLKVVVWCAGLLDLGYRVDALRARRGSPRHRHGDLPWRDGVPSPRQRKCQEHVTQDHPRVRNASEGEVMFEGEAISGLPTAEIVRRGISMVPENRPLFADMTVDEDLQLGAFLRSDKEKVAQDREQVLETFPRVREANSRWWLWAGR